MGFNTKLILSTIAATMSISAHASWSDLNIKNDTNFDSTSIINKGSCSTILGEHGVTKAHGSNAVPGWQLGVACGIYHVHDCKADIYMTKNCKGPIVATAEIDLDNDKGVKFITPTSAGRDYTFTWDHFSVIMSGGPAKSVS